MVSGILVLNPRQIAYNLFHFLSTIFAVCCLLNRPYISRPQQLTSFHIVYAYFLRKHIFLQGEDNIMRLENISVTVYLKLLQ